MRIHAMLAACAALMPVPALGQAPAQVSARQSEVSFSVTDASLKDASEQLEKVLGARVLVGPETAGRVTLSLAGVSRESAVRSLAVAAGHRWSRIRMPAEKAASLTAEQASALVSASETLAAMSASVQVGEAPWIGPAPVMADKVVDVYLIHTKQDPAAIRAAREAARVQREKAEEDARRQAVAASLSPDAGQDPGVVSAYSALQALSPDQTAMVAREYMLKATPEQRQAIGEALARQRDRFREAGLGQ